MKKHIVRVAAMSGSGFVAALLLAGCANAPGGPPEEQVRFLVESRWEKLMAGKLEDAYQMASPSYRDKVSFDAYRGTVGAAGKWTGVELISVKCEPSTCKVRLAIEIVMPAGFKYSGTIRNGVDETWVLEDGRWWVLLTP